MMLTRCPYCGTTFRVTPDQLKVRLGQVRCGQCRRVFDALRDLVDDTVRPPSSPPPVAPVPEQKPLPEAKVAPAAVKAPVIDEPAGFTQVDEYIDVIHVEPAAEPDEILDPETEPPKPPEPEPEPEPDLPPADETKPMPEAPAAALPEDLGPPTIFDLHEPPARRSRRWPWLLGSLLALVALAGQVLLHYRTELIAAEPESRPLFAAVCEQLGCELALPHRIDLIGIETSDLSPDEKNPGSLRLSARLRNRAPHTQAWPHLEVTLTDAQERPLLRRALAPGEYIAQPDVLAGGFPARSEHPVQLTLTATDIPAVGYRIYVFYP